MIAHSTEPQRPGARSYKNLCKYHPKASSKRETCRTQWSSRNHHPNQLNVFLLTALRKIILYLNPLHIPRRFFTCKLFWCGSLVSDWHFLRVMYINPLHIPTENWHPNQLNVFLSTARRMMVLYLNPSHIPTGSWCFTCKIFWCGFLVSDWHCFRVIYTNPLHIPRESWYCACKSFWLGVLVSDWNFCWVMELVTK